MIMHFGLMIDTDYMPVDDEVGPPHVIRHGDQIQIEYAYMQWRSNRIVMSINEANN